MKSAIQILTALTLLALSATSFASGGYSGGGGYSGSRSAQPAPSRAVDTVYETGKAIFKGRQQGEPALSYCINNSDNEKVAVKRKTLKQYKNQTYTELAQNLYNCDNPDSLIASELTRDSMLYVLYYLNKRHKLGLRSS